MKRIQSRSIVSLTVLMVFMDLLFSQELTFVQHPIDLQFPGIQCIKVVDLDQDGDLDIVGGSEITPTSASIGLAWWRNDGGNPIVWTRFTIDRSFIHVMSVDVADIDGDSYLDIVATSWQLHEVAWWKNSAYPTLSWSKNSILTGFSNAHDAQCADINADGRIDIVAANSTPGSIKVCYNTGIASSRWNTVSVAEAFAGAKSLVLIDLDKDGDKDIVATADQANEIAWWENQSGNPVTWKKRGIASGFIGVAGLDVVDINLDGKHDVLCSSWKTHTVAYWICNDLQKDSWTTTIVSTQVGYAANPHAADLDRDGDLDIVSIGVSPGELVVFEQAASTWNRKTLAGNLSGGCALALTDLDQDGDQDIVAGAAFIGTLSWWENRTPMSTGIDSSISSPVQFQLMQNYPNPFNPTTRIRFFLAEKSFVRLAFFDLSGKVLWSLADREYLPGNHTVLFDGSNLSCGVYLYRFQAGKYFATRKMTLLK
jgi:hypothetical protein